MSQEQQQISELSGGQELTAATNGNQDTQKHTGEVVIQVQPTADNGNHNERLSIEEPRPSRVVRPACQIAKAQAPIQACLRPAMWIPGIRNLHMARETWLVKAGLEEAIDKLVMAVEGIEKAELMEVNKVDKSRNYVEIFTFTQGCNWLDVVEVYFYEGNEPGTTRAESVSFSSGLFPAWFPLGFLCNCCCFFAPFSGNGQNTRRLELIRNAVQLDITVTTETKCNCCPS